MRKKECRRIYQSQAVLTVVVFSAAFFSCGSPAPRPDGTTVDSHPQADDPNSGGFPPLPEPETVTPTALSKSAVDEITDRHNRFRADHCAPPLTWSDTLASFAQDWANELKARGCTLSHSEEKAYGENLFFGGPKDMFKPVDAVKAWYSEIDEYDFESPGFEMKTGHFTQLVWQSTTSVGCGSAACPNGDLFVCEYYPPGNVRDRFEENVLNPTSCSNE